MSLEVLRVDDAAGLARVRAVRFAVFVGEFDITGDEELDDLDHAPGTVHVLAVDRAAAGPGVDDAGGGDGAARGHRDLGTARLVVDPARPGVVHITRVAVRKEARRSGAGRAVMAALEDIARREHAVGDPPEVRIELSVMETAVPFYRSLGYEIGDDRYLEVRIWHHAAWKVLPG